MSDTKKVTIVTGKRKVVKEVPRHGHKPAQSQTRPQPKPETREQES